MVLGSIKDIEEGNQIVPVIFQRFCNRLTHCLECGKMDDGINAELQDQYEQWGVTKDGHHCCTDCLTVTDDDRYVTPDGATATPLDGIRSKERK